MALVESIQHSVIPSLSSNGLLKQKMESRGKRVNEQKTNYSSRMFENTPYAKSPVDSQPLASSLSNHSLVVAMADP
jgi:hypothetical protein